jgi:hypothetical protein
LEALGEIAVNIGGFYRFILASSGPSISNRDTVSLLFGYGGFLIRLLTAGGFYPVGWVIPCNYSTWME